MKEEDKRIRFAASTLGQWIELIVVGGRIATADGPLEWGLYVAWNEEFGQGHMPVDEDGITDDGGYTAVLMVNGRLVRVPEVRLQTKERT